MAADQLYHEIWIPILAGSRNELLTLEGDLPLLPKGAEVCFKLAIFDTPPVDTANPGTFRNHSSLASFLLKIRSGSYAGTLLLDSSSGADVAPIDSTVQPADFLAKTKAPISIRCPTAITGIAAATQYMTFTGATNDAPTQPDYFGRARIEVLDVGIGAAEAPPAPAEQYALRTYVDAALQNKVSFGKNPPAKYPIFVSPGGRFGRPGVPPDDKGNPIGNLERYP